MPVNSGRNSRANGAVEVVKVLVVEVARVVIRRPDKSHETKLLLAELDPVHMIVEVGPRKT